MARDIQLAVAAAQLAVTDAGLVDGGVDPTRIGIDLGAGLISTRARRAGPGHRATPPERQAVRLPDLGPRDRSA